MVVSTFAEKQIWNIIQEVNSIEIYVL